MIVEGWGRYPRRDCRVTGPRSEADVRAQMAQGPLIARGNGRAYGDPAQNPNNTVDMRRMNRMLAFDAEAGQLTAEAGVLLGDVIDTFLPRGWFPWVTPGTKYVTLGGAIAADVHGKNHRRNGSFRAFVDWIDVMGADGQVRRCSRAENPELFDFTLGGMGLTGVILRAAIRLRPVESAWIRQTAMAAPNLAAAMEGLEAGSDAAYAVAWIDCLCTGRAMGRSLITLGEHATRAELPDAKRADPLRAPAKRKLTLPIDFPSFTINGLSVRAFNALYYRKGAWATGVDYVDWDTYFYPLDAILGWNRIYGRKGFAQFQCALPLASAREGLQALLKAISEAGQGSFLTVLKRLGPQESAFSFPMEGYTLAIDFPVNPASLRLLSELDAITIAHGGRFYLAKDSRMSADTLRRSDSRVDRFLAMRADAGRSSAFTSGQSERLSL